MVLELQIPHGTDLAALQPLLPVFLTYVLSFVYVGIYWNNHHHLLHATGKVNGRILWANLHLLFWLSLIPFTTGWMGENHFAALPTAVYGVVLLLAAIAYWILVNAIIAAEGPAVDGWRWPSARTSRERSRRCSILPRFRLAFVHQAIAEALYVAVALIWLVPDRRIESRMNDTRTG